MASVFLLSLLMLFAERGHSSWNLGKSGDMIQHLCFAYHCIAATYCWQRRVPDAIMLYEKHTANEEETLSFLASLQDWTLQWLPDSARRSKLHPQEKLQLQQVKKESIESDIQRDADELSKLSEKPGSAAKLQVFPRLGQCSRHLIQAIASQPLSWTHAGNQSACCFSC